MFISVYDYLDVKCKFVLAFLYDFSEFTRYFTATAFDVLELKTLHVK